MGRGISSPHKSRTDEDREFGQGRVPTISLDHCFLGTEADDDTAHTNPFLVIFDADTEAIYAVAVPDKSVRDWVVDYIYSVICELGYEGVKIGIKIDAARELREYRRLVAAKRSKPTIPLDVPVRESKGNGAVEKAVRTWTGQFRTLKCHLEGELMTKIDKKHPILQWMAWWAASLLCRVPVKMHGRTVFEYITGHKMKTPITCFGESVLYRKKRHIGELNKLDSEWSDGVFLGISGNTPLALIGTENGIVRTRDYRTRPEGPERWNKDLISKFNTTFQEYIVPSTEVPSSVVIQDPLGQPVAPPDAADLPHVRRMRLDKGDFIDHGYTAGCGGCIALQRGLGVSRNHTEQCRSRMEKAVEKSDVGRARKERVEARHEDRLTHELEREDELIQAKADGVQSEGELSDKQIEGMDTELFEPLELETGPATHSDARLMSPDRNMNIDIEEELQLESRPSSSTEVSARLAARNPAQTRSGSPIGRDMPSKKLKFPVPARDELDARAPAATRPVSDDVSMGPEEKRPRESMSSYTQQIPVRPDCIGQQLSSCVVSGRLYDAGEMKIMADMLMGVDITEVYSPERVNKLCKKFDLIPGDSFDVRTGYDLSLEKTQADVILRIKQTKPRLVIGCPPCTMFSRLQALNIHVHGPAWEAKFLEEKKKAVEHVKFCIKLFKWQMSNGAYFLFEHPAYGDTWKLPEMQELMAMPGVGDAVADQCMYGLTTRGAPGESELPAKKPTRFVSNSWYMLQELSVRCDKSHQHQHLVGGRASRAAEYPDQLCEAMCRGLVNQLKYDRSGRICVSSVANVHSFLLDVQSVDNERGENRLAKPRERVIQALDGQCPEPWRQPSKKNDSLNSAFPSHWVDNKHEPDGTAKNHLHTEVEVPEESLSYFHVGKNTGAELLREEMSTIYERHYGDAECVDDVSGVPLDIRLVRAARKLEMEYFDGMGVWAERLPKHVVKARGGKIIKGRWIDTNKGDKARPDYRSRFVGKEYNNCVDASLYAATPPLEALKLMIAHTASSGDLSAHIMFSDVKRAYFNAKARRELYVELPEEDSGYEEGYVGRLALALYGTRDAASLWQECLAEHLISLGFARGRSNSCVFFHAERGLRTLVHGDDYATVGSIDGIRWLQAMLQDRFEMKSVIVGHSGCDDVKLEGKFLNRIIRAVGDGWEYECDQRHVEALIEELGLQTAKTAATPMAEEQPPGTASIDLSPLDPVRSTQFRALAARANYISVDRPDAQFAIKELCREMSAPTEDSWARLKRVVRYFRDRPRVVLEFKWQDMPSSVDIFTDANWAGCRQARKSTSGGCIVFGSACVKSWSKTQATIATSSAESELIASVKGATEALGLVSLGEDLGIHFGVRLHIDAAAALGILERTGVGRVRHLDVSSLWLQEKELRKIIEMKKVSGLENPADVATKALTREKIDKCCEIIGCSFRGGRSKATADLHSIVRCSDRVESCDHIASSLPGLIHQQEIMQIEAAPVRARTTNSHNFIGQNCVDSLSVGEAKKWRLVARGCLQGVFKGARAFRSPSCTGIIWEQIVRSTTVASPSGEVLQDLWPQKHKVSEVSACGNIGGAADIVVTVFFEDEVLEWKDDVENLGWKVHRDAHDGQGSGPHGGIDKSPSPPVLSSVVPPVSSSKSLEKRLSDIHLYRIKILERTRREGVFPILIERRSSEIRRVSFATGVATLNSLKAKLVLQSSEGSGTIASLQGPNIRSRHALRSGSIDGEDINRRIVFRAVEPQLGWSRHKDGSAECSGNILSNSKFICCRTDSKKQLSNILIPIDSDSGSKLFCMSKRRTSMEQLTNSYAYGDQEQSTCQSMQMHKFSFGERRSRTIFDTTFLGSRENSRWVIVGSRLNPAALGREGETKILTDIPQDRPAVLPYGATNNDPRPPPPLRSTVFSSRSICSCFGFNSQSSVSTSK